MSVKSVRHYPPEASSQAATTSAAPALHTLPRPLIALRAGDCRYCVADTPEGEMHRALFCAAPAIDGPYCPDHRRLCGAPNAEDIDTLAAEIEIALNPSL